MPKLHVVTVSTRPSRQGPLVARWFTDLATAHGKFDVELVDLKAVNLPLLDESAHPRLKKYEHQHTKSWSAKVEEADAFVFVTPEYNYNVPATLVNALDYLYQEWAYKPVSFVSYGGVSGGMRSAHLARLLMVALRMVPTPDAVSIPGFSQYIKDGVFTGSEAAGKSSTAMLDELFKLANALAPLRATS